MRLDPAFRRRVGAATRCRVRRRRPGPREEFSFLCMVEKEVDCGSKSFGEAVDGAAEKRDLFGSRPASVGSSLENPSRSLTIRVHRVRTD